MIEIVRRVQYSRIEKLTEKILAKGGITQPSVNVGALMKREGIEIRSGDLGNISGLIARHGSRATVGVNSKQASVRQRFTMAHEYGHYFLHAGLIAHADEGFRINYRDEVSPQASDVEEIEANFFAACLLMPRPFLDALRAEDCLDDDAAVKRLSKLFDVSQHAMSLRLVNLYARCKPF